MASSVRMFKYIAFIFSVFYSGMLLAGGNDSLFVVIRNDKLLIEHAIKPGETVFTIADKYHVPPSVLADQNGLNYNAELKKGSVMMVPVNSYNQLLTTPNDKEAKAVYYKAGAEDYLSWLSRAVGVKQITLQEWNNLSDNTVKEGQRLMMGWVLCKNTGNEAVAENTGVVKDAKGKMTRKKSELPEGIRAMLTPEELEAAEAQAEKENYGSDSVSEEELLYLSQTNHGMFTANDKGTAVFFDMPGKAKSGKFYAFHNSAKRGGIIKIFNPGTNKTIFAKVLGPIPANEKYYNCIIAISAGAKAQLGLKSNKMWCELSYPPQ